ncbi:DUF4389 domain-containing protein [Nocardioides jensenii]|uniref:DUF4389 domain-containing protein n=1 Tax=Nocardioides jensenii TaxID=1843 RepID=UPI00082A41DB|nr:DUF4389 domain-containing protein [Nocardioides jensenii]
MDSLAYPVRVDATLQEPLSRWLWLVKWILVIPHYVVLALLWLAFLVLTVVAMVAIVVTGRYPRPIFDFNVGVLRWSWRVAYYSYGGLGSDSYPPFSLAERVDDPARLEVVYPERLSRGLALVKWWLLAIPHYLVLSLFLGGSGYAVHGHNGAAALGLIPLLVLIAGVALLFTGRYPRDIFDLVLGLNRWVLRAVAYVGLMTDRYPPFRLDLGVETAGGGGGRGGTPLEGRFASAMQHPDPVPSAGDRRRWGAGRIIAVVVASLAFIASLGLLSGGATLKVVDDVGRADDGYVTNSPVELRTRGHALVSREAQIRNDKTVVDLPARLIGRVRIEAWAPDDEDLFVGIAEHDDVAACLAGVALSTVGDPIDAYGDRDYRFTHGGAPRTSPVDSRIWAASAVGPGTQQITFSPREGSWSVVVMNADGSAPVRASVRVGATLPVLDDVATGLIWAGLVLLCGGGVGLWLAVRRR